MKSNAKNGLSVKELEKDKDLTVADIADLALQINEPELDSTKRKLLAFMLLPQGAVAKTKKKAEMAGVTMRRIRQIEAEPEFRELCIKHVKLNIGKCIPEVWQALVTNAKMGDTQAQLTILREVAIMAPPLEKRELSGQVTTINVQREAQKQVENLQKSLNGGENTEDIPYIDIIDEIEEKK